METTIESWVATSSHTPNVAGCSVVAKQLRDTFTQLTAGELSGDVIKSESGKYGDHLVLKSAATGAPTLLIGHHDTVFPAEHFAGFRKDATHLRGPGVFDMKGGLAVVAYALGALKHAGLLAKIPVKLISVSDEEIGSPEGRHVILRECLGARAALVFESGRKGDSIVTRRKGVGGISVIAHGKAAHAGNLHHEGRNAIWALARFIDRAQALTDYDAGQTVNVGFIEGGIGKNTVPERATANVDIRFLTTAQGTALITALHAAAETAAASVPGTRIELKGGISRQPLERSEKAEALFLAYAKAHRESGLGDSESALVGGGSDANTASEAGIPALDGLGPRGSGFHTLDEQTERASLLPKTEALVRYLASLTR
jgi:glutamate carboxypeptidase